MRFVLREKLFQFMSKTEYIIEDDRGNKAFKVKGKWFDIRDTVRITDLRNNTLVTIKQQLISLVPSYQVYRDGKMVLDVDKKRFNLLGDRFRVNAKDGSPDFDIKGNVFDLDYQIEREGRLVAWVSKRLLSMADRYAVDIAEGEEPVTLLALAVVIDKLSHDQDDVN